MKVVVANNSEFTLDGDSEVFTVTSIEAADGLVVSLIGYGIEVSMLAPTRGEGMVEIADYLKKLGNKLSEEAFIREGAIKL
jgi:hypothetical protein